MIWLCLWKRLRQQWRSSARWYLRRTDLRSAALLGSKPIGYDKDICLVYDFKAQRPPSNINTYVDDSSSPLDMSLALRQICWMLVVTVMTGVLGLELE